MEPDVTSIDYYHEAELAMRLGYSLFCNVEGIPGDLVVRDARMVGGDNRNLEVLVLEGWRRPSKCWGIGGEVVQSKEQAQVEQKGLFG